MGYLFLQNKLPIFVSESKEKRKVDVIFSSANFIQYNLNRFSSHPQLLPDDCFPTYDCFLTILRLLPYFCFPHLIFLIDFASNLASLAFFTLTAV